MTACLAPGEWTSVLECGCSTGRNLLTLRRISPAIAPSLIEIHDESYRTAAERAQPHAHFNGPILEAPFLASSFDLVFTCGVLIHVHPDDLLANCRRIVDWSRRYVLVAEYFSRMPVEIAYRGHNERLYKRDFGGFLLDHFPLRCIDYGFLWGRIYDKAGFDDVTWWVFEKTATDPPVA